VDADDELAGHAQLYAGLRPRATYLLDGAQGAQKVSVAGPAGGVEVHAVGAGLHHPVTDVDEVAGGVLHRLLDGRPALGDAALGKELEPVLGRSVRLRVESEVRLGAVLDRRREHELGVLHDLLLERQDGLDRLVAVLDVPEFEDVLAEALLAFEQVLEVRAGHLRAAAVATQDDLLADVDGGERRRRGVDVEQMVELVGVERRALGPAGPFRRARLDVGAQLTARPLDPGPVAHAGRYSQLRHVVTPARLRARPRARRSRPLARSRACRTRSLRAPRSAKSPTLYQRRRGAADGRPPRPFVACGRSIANGSP